MKKMFLAAITALALCSYGYAYDDEDEYEEDEESTEEVTKAPAVEEDEEEEEEAAPVKTEKKKKKKKKKSGPAVNGADGTLGFQLNLIDALDNDGSEKFYLTYKLAPDMELSLIFGFYHNGETTAEANGMEQDMGDDNTQIQIGVGFDYFVAQELLPISLGGEFLFTHVGEDHNMIDFGFWGGFRAKLVDNLYLTGKLGLAFNYESLTEFQDGPGEGGIEVDYSRFSFGLKTGVFISWFFI